MRDLRDSALSRSTVSVRYRAAGLLPMTVLVYGERLPGQGSRPVHQLAPKVCCVTLVTMSERLERLESLLPDYVCGLIWTFAVTAVISMCVTPTSAAAAVRELGKILEPVQIPEVAVGFLLVIFGVLLPYAISIIFAAFSGAIANEVYRRWYRRKSMYSDLSEAYLQAGLVRMCEVVRLPEPETSGVSLLFAYLQHHRSPAMDQLLRKNTRTVIQLYSVLPASILVGVFVYAATGQRWWGLFAGRGRHAWYLHRHRSPSCVRLPTTRAGRYSHLSSCNGAGATKSGHGRGLTCHCS